MLSLSPSTSVEQALLLSRCPSGGERETETAMEVSFVKPFVKTFNCYAWMIVKTLAICVLGFETMVNAVLSFVAGREKVWQLQPLRKSFLVRAVSCHMYENWAKIKPESELQGFNCRLLPPRSCHATWRITTLWCKYTFPEVSTPPEREQL